MDDEQPEVAWEGVADPPPGAPGTRNPGPMEDVVALLSRISENTRMTRQYVGWLLFLYVAGIVATVVVILNSGSDDSGGSRLFP